jgi:hypothetical protein
VYISSWELIGSSDIHTISTEVETMHIALRASTHTLGIGVQRTLAVIPEMTYNSRKDLYYPIITASHF